MPVPSPSHPVIPRLLQKDAAFDHLAAAVLEGTLQPGERLREADCEKWLGVSRTPIRMAVAKLEHVQLVESSGGRAISVVVPRRPTALDLVATACGLLSVALTTLVDEPDPRGRAEVARRLREAAVTGPRPATGPAGRGVDAPADAWASAWTAVWSALAERPSCGLVARHAQRLTLPLRHHATALSRGDHDRVVTVLAEAGRALERGPAAEVVAGLVEAVALLGRSGAPSARVTALVAACRETTPGPGRRPPAAPARASTERRPLDRARRRRLSDDVHDLVLRATLDGTLAPDERLVDDELTAWLGVSRTPIRHALERLDETGLVELAPNRHTRIIRPAPDDVVEARGLYAGLLSWSADLAARSADPTTRSGGGDEALAAIEHVAPIVERAEGRPLTLATMSCLGPTLRQVASVAASPSLSHELDLLEPRLVHGVVSCGFGLPRGSWRAFAQALARPAEGHGHGHGPGAACASLVAALCARPD